MTFAYSTIVVIVSVVVFVVVYALEKRIVRDDFGTSFKKMFQYVQKFTKKR